MCYSYAAILTPLLLLGVARPPARPSVRPQVEAALAARGEPEDAAGTANQLGERAVQVSA